LNEIEDDDEGDLVSIHFSANVLAGEMAILARSFEQVGWDISVSSPRGSGRDPWPEPTWACASKCKGFVARNRSASLAAREEEAREEERSSRHIDWGACNLGKYQGKRIHLPTRRSIFARRKLQKRIPVRTKYRQGVRLTIASLLLINISPKRNSTTNPGSLSKAVSLSNFQAGQADVVVEFSWLNDENDDGDDGAPQRAMTSITTSTLGIMIWIKTVEDHRNVEDLNAEDNVQEKYDDDELDRPLLTESQALGRAWQIGGAKPTQGRNLSSSELAASLANKLRRQDGSRPSTAASQ
jgi:hypothetical protein